jgi:hypothetical protein
MLREFAEIVAEFGPFRGMHSAESAGQLCENGRTRYEMEITGGHSRNKVTWTLSPTLKSF